MLTTQKLCFLGSSGGSLGRLAIIGNVSVSERKSWLLHKRAARPVTTHNKQAKTAFIGRQVTD